MPCRRQSSPTREGSLNYFFSGKEPCADLSLYVVRQPVVGLSLLRPATTPLHLRPQLYHCKGKHATPAFDQPRCISKSTLLHCITRKLSHPSNEDRRRPLSFCWYIISTTHRLHNCCLFNSKKRYTFAIIISHQYRINGEITVAFPISSSPCHHHSSSHPPPITHIYHLSHDSGGVTIAISVHIITISLRRKRSYSTNCLIGEILAYFIGRERL